MLTSQLAQPEHIWLLWSVSNVREQFELIRTKIENALFFLSRTWIGLPWYASLHEKEKKEKREILSLVLFKMCTFGVHFCLLQLCCVVGWLVGWLAQSHYSVRRPCHLSWKRFTGHNLPRKDFSSSICKKLHNWRIISCHCNSLDWLLHVCTEGQACYWPDIDLCLVGKKKAKEHLNIFFLDLFESSSWDWEWHQRLKSEKEFSFPHSKSVPHQASPL